MRPASADKPKHRRGVAQPGSALAWGARGRVFESLRPDHILKKDQALSGLVLFLRPDGAKLAQNARKTQPVILAISKSDTASAHTISALSRR